MGEQVSHFDISEFLHFNQPTGTASQDQDFQVGKWFSVLWSRSRSEPVGAELFWLEPEPNFLSAPGIFKVR